MRAIDPRARIYYLRMHDGTVKIGTTCHMASRMRTLQPAEVLAVEVGAYFEEQARHRQFADARVSGEYFRPTDALLAHIATLQHVPIPSLRHDAPDPFLGRSTPPMTVQGPVTLEEFRLLERVRHAKPVSVALGIVESLAVSETKRCGSLTVTQLTEKLGREDRSTTHRTAQRGARLRQRYGAEVTSDLLERAGPMLTAMRRQPDERVEIALARLVARHMPDEGIAFPDDEVAS